MGLFDDDEWGRPVDGSGEFARVEQLANHLLIVFPIGYIDHHPTKFTVPGKKSDVIVSDLIDLDDVNDEGTQGKVYRTAWWRQSQLIISLRPWIGRRVLGRITKGVARNGMNPPWVITDASPEPGAIDRVKIWAAANPSFALSVFQEPTIMAPPSNGGPPRQQYAQPPQYAPAPDNYYQSQQYASPPPPPQPLAPPQPQPQYAPPPPPAQYPQPAPPPQYPQPQYPQPQYQGAGPQAPGYPPQQDPGMLSLMRAQRERREETQYPQSQDPPF